MRFGPLLILLIFTVCVAGFAVATATPDPVYRVASGSMAPAVLGPHFPLSCQQCAFSTAIDASNLPEHVTCPNCGFQDNLVDPTEVSPGHGLAWEPIEPDQLQRWDVVLLEYPDTKTWQVKRLAFLPGERPEIRHGELYRDSQLIRKSPKQRESLKQLVFDQSHDWPEHPRFRTQRASGSGWNVHRGSLGFAPIGDSQANDNDWLVYHHYRCLPPPSPVDHAASPLDSYGYNHSVSRELFSVSDLWIEFRCEHWQAQQLTVRVQGESQTATIEIDIEHQVVRLSGGEKDIALPLSLDSLAGITVRAGECDADLFLELKQAQRHWYFPLGDAGLRPGSRPFALKVGDGQAVLREVKIYRDIVWLGRQRRPTPWSLDRELAPHEIFVLGDNVPISDDSRYELGAVDTRKHLRGKVLRVLQD